MVAWIPPLLLALVLAVAPGCSSTPTDATPIGATRLFVAAMEHSVEDRHGLEDAYHLLSLATRERLVARAREAAALGAAERQPWEMLVEGTAHLRFTPRAGGYREQPSDSPDRVIVVVSGRGSGETASLPLVREEGAWRIELQVPDARPADPVGESPVE